MEKPTLPKGTRDFGPAQMAKRQFIFDNIKRVFQKYGFQPLETPAMENLSTLTGKYGDEGDNLLFKILESGEFYEKAKGNIFKKAQALKYAKQFIGSANKVIPIELNQKFWQEPERIIDYLQELNDRISNYDLVDQVLFKNLINQKYSLIFWLIVYRRYEKKEEISIEEEVSNLIFDTLFLIASSKELAKDISEKGLRYDLTVPFARYVVMNRGEITFPFKRYQIQPVWRADRPQKGRYREFYQCDADVVGTDSLICEAEIILMIKEVFSGLGINDYSIKINHRGILAGLAELANSATNQSALFVAIDKLDKIGEEKVREELLAKDFSESSLNTVFEILNLKGNNEQKIEFLQSKFSSRESGTKGLTDLKEVFSLLESYGNTTEHVEFDIALARGLSYYTGCIFEVKINNVSIGSVSGGGRYDNLTGVFDSKDKNSGVGFSFGVDRLYDAMEEIQKVENRALFPKKALISSNILICHFDEASKRYGLKVLQALRTKGIASEIYPDAVKIQKQLDYANKKSIPFVIVIGSEEVSTGLLTLKNMEKGEQQKLKLEDILNLEF